MHFRPSSGQRMHRTTEPSPPHVVDARHAADVQNRNGLGRRLGGSGRRRATTPRSPAFSQRHAVAEEDRAQGGTMPQPGDIVIERLTGNRALVIRVVSPEEMICRFRDGRFEERFTFELERPPSPFGSLLSFFVSTFLSWFRQRSEEHTSELQSLAYLVCRLLLEKKKKKCITH